MSDVHNYQGFGSDIKYSKWRRYKLKRWCYCTDIDWVEWRNGKPVDIIEGRRLIGNLKTFNDAIKHFIGLNNGFQLEVYARISHDMGIRAFFVAINDPHPENEEYNGATFKVVEIKTPKYWVKDLTKITLVNIGTFDEKYIGKNPELIKILYFVQIS